MARFQDLFEEYLGAGAVRSAKVLYGSDGLALGAAIVTLARHRDVRRAYACFNGSEFGVVIERPGSFAYGRNLQRSSMAKPASSSTTS